MLRQGVTALAVVALCFATSCSGDGEAEGSATGGQEPTAVASRESVETITAAETDPAAWRIRANAECNSMVVFYEAVFRRQGRPKPAEIAAAGAEALGDW